jgi:peptide/nickel transport system substrate-binding protein
MESILRSALLANMNGPRYAQAHAQRSRLLEETAMQHALRLFRFLWCPRWLMVAMALLAAPLGPPAAARSTAAGPVRVTPGGSVAFRLLAAPDCLDPQRTASGPSHIVMGGVFDTLLSLDDHRQIRPALATAWEISHGGTWITFHLRQGVRFSNGDPLDAAAVQFTFDRALNPATKSPVTASELQPVKQVQALDRYTIRLILTTPNRPLLGALADAYTGIVDPRAVRAEGDGFCQAPVGSGPYRVQTVGPGFSTVTLTRNALHTWAPPWAYHQGPAYLSTIVWKAIGSDTTAVSELLTGGLDVSDVAGDQLSRVNHDATIVLQRSVDQGEVYLGYNTAHVPFGSRQARLAVAEAIDRAALIAVATSGQAKPALSVVPSSLPYYDPQAQQYAPRYNFADAQRLIHAYPNVGPIRLLVLGLPEYTTAAEYIQGQLEQLGVKVAITPTTLAELAARGAAGQYDLVLLPWGASDPDILYLLFQSSQAGPDGLNITFYRNATLDRLLVEGRQTTDPRIAARVYAQVQRLIGTLVLVDPLYTQVTTLGILRRVRGFHVLADHSIQTFLQDLYVTS